LDTPEAKAVATFYEDALLHCLRDIKPSFAVRRSGELVNVAKPPFGWDKAHRLPQDSILVIEVDVTDFGEEFRRQWRVEGLDILSNRDRQLIIYIARTPETEGLMDGSFVKALAAFLASELAYPLTNDSNKIKDMFALYKDRRDNAMAAYGQESSTVRTENEQLSRIR